MSVATQTAASGAGERSAGLDRLWRSALFMAAFCLFWVSVKPFHDLTDPALLQPGDKSNLLNQIAVIGVAACALAFILSDGWRTFAALLSIPFLATLAAIALSVVLSAQPELSFKRFVLALLIIVIAATCLKLPTDRRHFADLLTVGAFAVLALCYAGVLLAPSVSIHHLGEVVEPEHAGSWRGLFEHKNQTGAAMVLLVFVGIFVARVRSGILGGTIIALTLLFLLNTGAKTPLGLLPVMLLLAALLTHLQSLWARVALLVGALGFFALLTVGSVFIPAIGGLLAQVMSDPSFTNRDDVWRFAAEQAAARPFFGHGFEAFWGTPAVVFSGNKIETWAAATSDAHNAYLDIAVTCGLVALIPAIAWLVLQPVFDLHRSAKLGNDPALAILFVQIWLFGAFAGCLEKTFFSGGGPLWFFILVAVFGLRFHATARAVT